MSEEFGVCGWETDIHEEKKTNIKDIQLHIYSSVFIYYTHSPGAGETGPHTTRSASELHVVWFHYFCYYLFLMQYWDISVLTIALVVVRHTPQAAFTLSTRKHTFRSTFFLSGVRSVSSSTLNQSGRRFGLRRGALVEKKCLIAERRCKYNVK